MNKTGCNIFVHFARYACSIGAWVFVLLFNYENTAYAQAINDAASPNVTIVVSEKSGSYEEFSHALDGLLSGSNVAHRVIAATETIPDSGLTIAVGMKAATAVAASNAPSVLNVLITKSSHAKLLLDFPRRAVSPGFSTIYLDQPIRRQVNLIAAILPGKHNVGMLYLTPPKELSQIKEALKAHGLTVQEQEVSTELALPDALQEILLGRSEMLLALPDAVVYNESTLRNILLATYRRGIPLIGFSAGYVKAGALCALISTPAQIAAQAAELSRQFAVTRALPPPQYPHEFEVLVNEPVARALDLQVKGATALHDKIRGEIEEAP